MFADNLLNLRKQNSMTQEELAEKLGVTRQAVAKWESAESTPDLEKSRLIAEVFGVSLDDLVNYSSTEEDMPGLNVPPKGKHLFGVVTLGEKGQIVIPAKARKIFNLNPGDSLAVLGDEGQGIALIKSDQFLAMADIIRETLK